MRLRTVGFDWGASLGAPFPTYLQDTAAYFDSIPGDFQYNSSSGSGALYSYESFANGQPPAGVHIPGRGYAARLYVTPTRWPTFTESFNPNFLFGFGLAPYTSSFSSKIIAKISTTGRLTLALVRFGAVAWESTEYLQLTLGVKYCIELAWRHRKEPYSGIAQAYSYDPPGSYFGLRVNENIIAEYPCYTAFSLLIDNRLAATRPNIAEHGGLATYDDFALNDDTGSVHNTWPGMGTVQLLRPIADIDVGDWHNGTTGSPVHTNLYDAVNNIPPYFSGFNYQGESYMGTDPMIHVGKMITSAVRRGSADSDGIVSDEGAAPDSSVTFQLESPAGTPQVVVPCVGFGAERQFASSGGSLESFDATVRLGDEETPAWRGGLTSRLRPVYGAREFPLSDVSTITITRKRTGYRKNNEDINTWGVLRVNAVGVYVEYGAGPQPLIPKASCAHPFGYSVY